MMHSISSTVRRSPTAHFNGSPHFASACSKTESEREFLVILYVSVLRSCDVEVAMHYELR